MARTNLGALLGSVENDPPQKTREASPAKPAVKAEPIRTVGQAGYLRFVRKETRLRDDQQNALTQHARRLNRAKAPGSARITDNTLIRVAVDLLLERIDSAVGSDEDEILSSLEAPAADASGSGS
jgi:hypothetical protein